MNKKKLIGSIIAVAVLIGVSFTSVVGYRSVDSDVKASPLFNIRSSRAIDEENQGLVCEYVGKGEDINLLIPDRDAEIEKIRRIIEIIQELDDEPFKNIVDLIINRIQKNEFNDVKSDDVILALNKLRNHQDLTISNITNMAEMYTLKFEFIPTLCWLPGCFTFVLLYAIVSLLAYILLMLFKITIRCPCTTDTSKD